MRPLSPSLYNKRNKRKIFASINSVMVAVCFVHVLYAFTESVVAMASRNDVGPFKNSAIVMNYGQKPIGKGLIKNISQNMSVDRIIPTMFNYAIKYSVPGNSDRANAVPIRPADRNYFMKRLGIKLIQGSLPREGLKEIALNKDIAKNRNVEIGDKVGDGVHKYDNLPGEYLVVGLLDSESTLSILSVNENIYPGYKNRELSQGRGFYVFPREGKRVAMNAYIESLPKNKVNAYTENTVLKRFEENLGAVMVIDVISILSIVVMVVTVGSSKYAQYINRKEELGLLNAIGYNKMQILSRTLKEVVIVNMLGFILGIALGLTTTYGLHKGLWEPEGARGVLFTAKGFVVSAFIPLFTILFSIIPINNMIIKLDPIKMIEKN